MCGQPGGGGGGGGRKAKAANGRAVSQLRAIALRESGGGKLCWRSSGEGFVVGRIGEKGGPLKNKPISVGRGYQLERKFDFG